MSDPMKFEPVRRCSLVYGSRLFLKFFFWFWLTVLLTSVLVGAYAYYFHIEPEMRFFEQIHLENLQENAAQLAKFYEVDGKTAVAEHAMRGLDWFYDEELNNLIKQNDNLKQDSFYKYDKDKNRYLQFATPENLKKVKKLAKKAFASNKEELVEIADLHFQACITTSDSNRRYVAIRPLSWKRMRKHIYLLKKLLKILPLFILISVPLCFALGRYMARPIVDISQASREFAAGNLDARINSGSAARFDEIGDLAKDFNLMAQRLQNMINGQQKLLGDISHELRSPLARMQIALEILEKKAQTANQPMFKKIHLEIVRLNELIGKILQINRLNSSRQSIEKADLNLLQVLQPICDDAIFEGQGKNVKISLSCDKELHLMANLELLAQAVENVVRNAVKYSQKEGEIQLLVAADKAKNEVSISISDGGPGIARHHLPRIFEPFYRCQDDRDRKTGGVGLGLAITYHAVLAHKGTISISNLESGGLQVEIKLPKS